MNRFKKSIIHLLLFAVAVLVSVVSSNAQVIYLTTGPQGAVNRFSTSGVNLGSLISYGAGVNVQGIAVDGSGDVFLSVTNGATRTIQRVTAAGVGTTYATLTNSAAGLTFNNAGVLYGVQIGGGASGGNAVGIYTAGGFTPISLSTSPFAPFYSAQSVRFDNLGNMYVTNSSSGGVYANSIVKLTPNGSIWDISLFASTSGFAAYDMAFDNLNNLYVSSSTTAAAVPIRKYSPAGVQDSGFAVTGGSLLTPRGLLYANGSLYEADYSTQRINQINPATGVATVFAIPPNFNDTYLAYTPIPEPSQMLLMGLGGLVMLFRRRR